MDEPFDLLPVEFEKVSILRHDLHRTPELSHNEVKTKKILMEAIEGLDVKINEVKDSNGFFIDLEADKSNSFIALRADMDGLPVKEENNIDFRSANAGKMHACGHDGHMSSVFGALLILQRNRRKLRKSVRFIYQPAEEEASIGGAREMIEGGCLENVSYISGLHIWPELQEGKIGIRKGPFFAGLNKYQIEVRGGSTHTARPDLSDPNTIYVANEIISAIAGLVNRRAYPWAPFTVNVARIDGSPGSTIIRGIISHTLPDSETVAIEPRTTLGWITSKLKKVAESIAAASGATAKLEVQTGYPPLVNDPATTGFVTDILSKAIGAENIITPPMTLGGEDFSLYLEKVPGSYMLLGSNNPALGFTNMIHTPKFNFNDGILRTGSKVLSEVAYGLSDIKR